MLRAAGFSLDKQLIELSFSTIHVWGWGGECWENTAAKVVGPENHLTIEFPAKSVLAVFSGFSAQFNQDQLYFAPH